MAQKNLAERLTYAYIRRIKKWMFCPACKEGKMIINNKSTLWTCKKCGYKLSTDQFEDDYVFWFCDKCDSYLNIQEGFKIDSPNHICTNCGYENDISVNSIENTCNRCGAQLSDSKSTLCDECKFERWQKVKAWGTKALKIIGISAVVVGAAYVASKASSSEDGEKYAYLPESEDDEEYVMKCANCGNTNENTLWDDGETIHCSLCHHNTLKATGEDDVVECPYCHRMRDRRALYCRYCNDSAWEPSTPEEFEEIDESLKEIGY